MGQSIETNPNLQEVRFETSVTRAAWQETQRRLVVLGKTTSDVTNDVMSVHSMLFIKASIASCCLGLSNDFQNGWAAQCVLGATVYRKGHGRRHGCWPGPTISFAITVVIVLVVFLGVDSP